MQLRNKKTGEIGNLVYRGLEDERIWVWIDNISKPEYRYNSLAELNKEWEDCEEPKKYWYIDIDGEINYGVTDNSLIKEMKEIGNYFETKEEAEKAVERLRAWKRLKDRGLHVTTFYVEDGSLVVRAKTHNSSGAENWEDLDLLFGGEE